MPVLTRQRITNVCCSCGKPLQRQVGEVGGIHWACPGCGGRFVGVGSMKRLIDPKFVMAAWTAKTAKKGRPCPGCTHAMETFLISASRSPLELDRCRVCYAFWLDGGEWDRLPDRPVRPTRRKPVPADEGLAPFGDAPDQFAWRSARRMLRHTAEPSGWRAVPILTLTLVALLVAFELNGMLRGLGLMLRARWGFVPGDPLRDHGLRFLTSALYQPDFIQTLVNLYLLGAFGAVVELDVGRAAYPFLLAAALVAGNLATMAFTGSPDTPHVGAGAAAFAVATYFLLRFRGRRVVAFFYNDEYVTTVPGWGAFAAVLFLELIARMQFERGTSYWPHLAGVLVGALFWLVEGLTQHGHRRRVQSYEHTDSELA